MIRNKELLLGFGILIYAFSYLIVLLFNPSLGGARADSYFYMKMFEYRRLNHSLIPYEDFQVATSPIYVEIIGLFRIFCGSFFVPIIHFLYFCFAILSIYFLVKVLETCKVQICIPLVALFASSGYFIAPSIWPTSDAPAVLFLILTIYMFRKNRNIGFAIASCSLVSTRQNFAWVLAATAIVEISNFEKISLNSFRSLLKYIPASLSLITTFFYFGRNLTPVGYESINKLNKFELPNFLNSIQIGIAAISIFSSIALLIRWRNLNYDWKSRRNLLIVVFSAFPWMYFLAPSSEPIQEGLGWISLFSLNLHLNLFWIGLIASVGLAIFVFLVLQSSGDRVELALSMTISLLISSLVMPIPFLRYFEISIILIFILFMIETSQDKKSILMKQISFASVLFVVLNTLKTLS